MQIVEIYGVDAKPPQRSVTRLAYALRAGVLEGPMRRAVNVTAALGADYRLVSPAGDGPADEFLVRMRPIHLGRVQQVQALVEGVADGIESAALVHLPVASAGEGHATDSDCTDYQSGAEPTRFHSQNASILSACGRA